MPRLGAVTIGQSPRTDIIPELRTVLGAEIEIVEAGALDGLAPEEIRALAPVGGDTVLVTRLRDGSGVRVGHQHVVPRLVRRVEEIAAQVDAVLLLCTGSFHPFRTEIPVLYPERLLFGLVRAVAQPRDEHGVSVTRGERADLVRGELIEGARLDDLDLGAQHRPKVRDDVGARRLSDGEGPQSRRHGRHRVCAATRSFLHLPPPCREGIPRPTGEPA